MTTEQAFAVSKWLIRLVPITLITWDVFVFAIYGRTATISHAMWTWSLRYRWFALAVMMLAMLLSWHFFVGQV